jgi:hypothetical protein
MTFDDVDGALREAAQAEEQVTRLAISPAILRQIAEGIATDLRPVRPMVAEPYFFGALVGIFVSFVAISAYRMGAFAIAVMTPLETAAMLSALAIAAGLLAYSLVGQMVPGSRHGIPPVLLPVGIAISLAITIAVLFPFQQERHFWIKCWGCIRAGAPIGILASVPFWMVLRRGAILSPGMTGAATGLFAGLVGTSVLEIHCPNLDAWHILVSHLGVAILFALVGFLTGLTAEVAGGRSVRRSNQEFRALTTPPLKRNGKETT